MEGGKVYGAARCGYGVYGILDRVGIIGVSVTYGPVSGDVENRDGVFTQKVVHALQIRSRYGRVNGRPVVPGSIYRVVRNCHLRPAKPRSLAAGRHSGRARQGCLASVSKR